MRRWSGGGRGPGEQSRACANHESAAEHTRRAPPAGLARLIEKKKTPKNAEKAVRIPQGKSEAQADVADGENRQRVCHGPKTSGKKRPNNQVRRPANIGADR